jgi:hypothetical protein
MNLNLITILSMTGWLAFASVASAENEVFDHRLEPCLNGEVSARGLYPTQAEEDAALAKAQARTGRRQPQNATVKQGITL